MAMNLTTDGNDSRDTWTGNGSLKLGDSLNERPGVNNTTPATHPATSALSL